ncbi:helix-turn-helix domain-containing protein [Mesorhizobium sp. DCY119]|uniref:AraC family transcriptional regulator n=1 Tax=Mesorhizobium sp. DCY119 TaxID=2108445 RepID=UPI000E6CF2F6|nr:helix-turn-helix domain-containing protein [Mesorhizobium sp. DCY119]RJG44600.1 helix-turn-helix domain-containing protein [Mesorhizobium sp. DCY119]
MSSNENHDHDGLRRLLLQRLRPLALDPDRPHKTSGMHVHADQLFSYCCFDMERLALVTTAEPLIGIVLSGEKEFWIGGMGQRFGAGEVFVLPAGLECDVVNIPGERSGLYESLLVEVPRTMPKPAKVRHRHVSVTSGFDMRVRLTGELVDAVAHAAIALRASAHAESLATHRLGEVLLLLRDEPAAQCLFDTSLADRIGWLVLGEPARQWTAADIGREIGLGASTLRRRLAEDGTSLRKVLASSRMQLAHELLTRGEGNVTEAAEAAGYASRSHFVRRFQSVYGASPSEHRVRRA